MARSGHSRAIAWWGAVFFAALALGLFWIFEGRYIYGRIDSERTWRESIKRAPECLYRWENMRKLQTLPRPGSDSSANRWHTAVYYELVFDPARPEQRQRFIALYDGKDPKLETCEDKMTGRYGGAEIVDPRYPPVAMTMFEGSFVLQTTDDPMGGVALDKLPLLFGPRAPIVTKK